MAEIRKLDFKSQEDKIIQIAMKAMQEHKLSQKL